MGYRYKRIFAFILDLLLVVFLSTCMSEVEFFNPLKYDYHETYIEYNEVYNDNYNDFIAGNISPTEFLSDMTPYIYRVETTSLFQYLWYLIFFFLYFVVFAYFTGGQTLGKKLFNLEVRSIDDSKVSFKSLAIKALFNGSSFAYGMNILIIINELMIVFIDNQNVFFQLNTIFSSLALIYEIVFILMFVWRRDHRTVHDIISKTKVCEK